MPETLESSLLYRREDGSQDFVHDTYKEFFLVKYFANKINSGELPVEKAAHLMDKASDRYGRHYPLSEFPFQVADVLGDTIDFVCEVNSILLSPITKYFGKPVFLNYMMHFNEVWEADFEDPSMRMILDGIAVDGRAFYFLGHDDEYDYIIAPGGCSESGHASAILKNIETDDGDFEPKFICRSEDYDDKDYPPHQGIKEENRAMLDPIFVKRDIRARIRGCTNQFIDEEYLARKGMKLLFPRIS